MGIERKISFEFGKVELLKNSIIRVVLYENSTIDFDESYRMNKAIGELSNFKEALVLVVAETGAVITAEARNFSASEQGQAYSIAEALVVTNLAHKIIANFYLKINKPIKPCKVFNAEIDAVNWLLEFNKK
ncbi:MAG: hypothetical protein LCH32_11250 [Bacteroidetes bacterium]|nr:hypothetical protein [Bacteroidota bacterium]